MRIRDTNLITILEEVGTVSSSSENFESFLAEKLEESLEVAIKNIDFLKMPSHIICETSESIVSALIDLDRLDEARRIMEEGYLDEYEARLGIILAQAKRGEPIESIDMLAEAIVEGNRHVLYSLRDRLELNLEILSNLTHQGRQSEAKEIADKVGDKRGDYSKLKAYLVIAVAEAEAGLQEEAKELIRLSSELVEKLHGYDGFLKFEIYSEIAVAQDRAGMHEEADKTISFILSELEKRKDRPKHKIDYDYFCVAIAQAKLSQFDEAVKTISENANNFYTAYTYAKIGSLELKLKDNDKAKKAFDLAFEAAKGVSPGFGCQSGSELIYPEIALGYTELGEHEKAEKSCELGLKVAEKAFDDRDYALADLAPIQAKLGLIDKAIETAERIPDSNEHRIDAYLGIASEQAKAKDYAEAKKSLELSTKLANQHSYRPVAHSKIVRTCNNILQTLKAA